MTAAANGTAPSAPTTSDATIEDKTRLRTWGAKEWSVVLDVSAVHARRVLLPALEADGVLRRLGRRWVGRVSEVEAWMQGRWIPPKLAGRR